MNAYVDTSVVLRLVLGQPQALEEWSTINTAVSSELVRVEGARTIDRARAQGTLDIELAARKRRALAEELEGIDLVPLDPPVLLRAAEPFPFALGTLDALHLATALLLRAETDDLIFVTHDQDLADAARAFDFHVFGA